MLRHPELEEEQCNLRNDPIRHMLGHLQSLEEEQEEK